jgi:NAD(P)-dependent dehydrogenase (short-subunit alcohol dehydrogenase family)
MVKVLAREGAPDSILVNGVHFGYCASSFHERWHKKTKKDMQEQAKMVPLKRWVHAHDAAALMIYLLSGWAGFIRGQNLPLTGGDWL